MDTPDDNLKRAPAARKRFRRATAIAAGVVTLAAILWSGLWWFGARALEGAVADALIAGRAQGEEIAVEKVTVGGFPVALTVTVDALTWTARLPAGPLTVAVPRLAATATPLAPRRFRLAAPAPFTVAGGEAFSIVGRLAAGALTLGAVGSAGRIGLDALRLTRPDAPPVTVRGLTAAWSPAGDGYGAGDRRITLVANGLEGLGTAPDRTAETAAEIRVSGRLSGPLAGANAVDWAEWRDAGGMFETDEIAIAWADLRVSGSGGWTLDKALRPAGAGTFEVAGLPALIDRWAAAGHLPARHAAIARLAVGALAGGAKGRVKVPVSLQAGQLWIGPFAVADLPALAW